MGVDSQDLIGGVFPPPGVFLREAPGKIQSRVSEGPRMIYGTLHSTDKRENPRKNFGGRIIINHPSNTPSIISAWIQNISVGGVRVEIGTPVSPVQKGDEVRFIINREYFYLEGEGEIIWISPVGDAVGIKFNQIAEKTPSSLEQFLMLLT